MEQQKPLQLNERTMAVLNKIEFCLCTIFVGFHLYTAFFGNLKGFAQAGVHVGLILSIAYIRQILKVNGKKRGIVQQVLFTLIIVFSLGYGIYIWANAAQLLRDSTTFTSAMFVLGIAIIIVLLYSCWKFVGPAMSILAIIFIAYAFFGKYFPSILRHAGMKPKRFLHLVGFTSEGIFGSPLNASSSYIAIFIALGSLFNVTGVGDYLCDFSKALLGKFRGGPAKVAVVASCMFGSISGSSVANVVGTGTFTIPLMKKIGYDSEFAGAVEATASTGGAIMPPVMGAAAFLLAEIVGTKYWNVVTAAFIPALLYYMAVLIQVDLYALRNGLKGMDKSELPELSPILKNIWKLSPIVLLVAFIGPFSMTIQRAGIYTFLYTLLLSFFSKESRFTKDKLIRFIRSAAGGCISVAIATATAGIIIGCITGSGLSIRLSSILVKLAGGSLPVLLILTMLASIVMGMGLPVSACYLMLAALVAPTIVKLGVAPMAAHLFVLYFGIISNVTPPVAMAAYAAAGIAECNPTRCGYKAFKLASAGFVLPYFFVYNNALLMMGSVSEIIMCCVSAAIGIYCLACMLEGTIWNAKLDWIGRIFLGAASFCLIDSNAITDIIGLAIVVLVHVVYNLKAKKQNKSLKL